MLRETRMPIVEDRDIAALSRNPGSEAERLKAFEAHREITVAQVKRTVIWLTRVPRFGKPGDSQGSRARRMGCHRWFGSRFCQASHRRDGSLGEDPLVVPAQVLVAGWRGGRTERNLLSEPSTDEMSGGCRTDLHCGSESW